MPSNEVTYPPPPTGDRALDDWLEEIARRVNNITLDHDSELSGISSDDHHAQQHDIEGSDHTASDLASGEVLKATSATAFAFQALVASDIPTLDHDTDLSGVSADDHHAQDHASRHITGGADEVDGDKLDIDFTPSNYTPSTSPSEASSADHLTAHLSGIDSALSSVGLQSITLTYSWSSSSSAVSRNPGFDPECAFAIGVFDGNDNAADGVLCFGFARETNINFSTAILGSQGTGSTHGTFSDDANAIGGTLNRDGGVQGAHTVDIDVTAWSSSDITLNPSASVTGTIYLLVLG